MKQVRPPHASHVAIGCSSPASWRTPPSQPGARLDLKSGSSLTALQFVAKLLEILAQASLGNHSSRHCQEADTQTPRLASGYFAYPLSCGGCVAALVRPALGRTLVDILSLPATTCLGYRYHILGQPSCTHWAVHCSVDDSASQYLIPLDKSDVVFPKAVGLNGSTLKQVTLHISIPGETVYLTHVR